VAKISISLFFASPLAMRSSTRHIQPVSSRQGVHWHLLIEGALLAAFAMRAHAAFGLWLAAALVA
jgi:hypothetical protein